MASLDDDDESQSYDFEDSDLEALEPGAAPDDRDSIRCASCKKWILEGCQQCPYCKDFQLEEKQNRKPFWFIVAVAVCIFLCIGYVYFGG